MEVLPANSQEVARLRCQKSGCRENEEEPTLIVASSSSSSSRTKVFPLLTSWIVAFFLLRLAAHYIRKLIPIIRREAPQIRAVVGHYIHSMMDLTTTTTGSERNNNSGLRMKKGRSFSTRSRSSNKSLGSLAELLDDSGRSGRGTSLWYDNDNDSSSSAGYSSSAYTRSYTDDDDKSQLSMVESQSEFGSSVYSESTGSSYNNYDDDQSRGGESIVSKFLSYISESKGHHRGGYDNVKRRSSVDHNLVHGTTANEETVGLYNPKRRSTVDETNHYLTQHRSQNATITNEMSNQRRETPNAAESLLSTQSKPSSSGGVKMRKTSAAATAAKAKSSSQDYDNSDDNGKTKSSKEESKNNKSNNKSRLHHHLSKFSSSSTNNEDDNEQYSTMLSTVDLRSRGTRDTRATWNSGSFVGNK